MTHTIDGIKNETYTILKKEDISELGNLVKHLKERNFDGHLYHMERIIAGTRKKAQTVLCYKAANHDTFVAA